MNAKEKAKELINMMFDTLCNKEEAELTFFQKRAYQCALITVDEILKIKLWGKTDGENDKDFWAAVKAEILNVQPGDEVKCGVGEKIA